MPAAHVCKPPCPEKGSVLVCLRSFGGFLIVWLYIHTGEGQSNFNTLCARKCGILKIKPHYLNVLLEEET
jgi:hypothetical protein